MKRPLSLLLLLVLVAAPLITRVDTVNAATIIVTTTADEPLAGTTSACSLREAIIAANTNVPNLSGCGQGTPGIDTITIPAGTYTLGGTPSPELLTTQRYPGEGDMAKGAAMFADPDAGTGDLDITEGVIINGAGMGATIVRTTGQDRVFQVYLTAGNPVYISNLTITGGGTVADGGGIQNLASTLILTNVHVTGNASANSGGGVAAQWAFIPSFGRQVTPVTVMENTMIEGNTSKHGGGFYTEGYALLNRSSVISNTAPSGAGLDNNDLSGMGMRLTEVTVGDNNGTEGSAIANSALLTMINTTVVVKGAAPGVRMLLYSTWDVRGSILARLASDPNVNADVCAFEGDPVDVVMSGGYNMESRNSCGLGAFDIKNTNPQLQPLANHGLTKLYAMPRSSPAVEAGASAGFCFGSAADQRGVNRPMDAAPADGRAQCDIGAYEYDGAYYQPYILEIPFTAR